MTPIEIIALVFALVVAVKIIVILIKAETWMKFVKFIYSNSVLAQIISLILAGVTLYYLVRVEGLSIVQIFAVFLFISFLMVLSFAVHSKDTIGFANTILKKKKVIRKYWLALIIWIVLIIWFFKELLM